MYPCMALENLNILDYFFGQSSTANHCNTHQKLSRGKAVM